MFNCQQREIWRAIIPDITHYSKLTPLDMFFPELVWRKILQFINSKEDLIIWSNESPFFGKLLQNEILKIVFAILAEKYTSYFIDYEKSDDEIEPENTRQNACLNVRKPEISLLKMRLVCRIWNCAIEELFEANAKLGKKVWKWSKYRFGNKTVNYSAKDFVKHFHSSHSLPKFGSDSQSSLIKLIKNPFLGRSVTIEYSIDFWSQNGAVANKTNYYLELARQYGQAIWFLKIRYDCWLRAPPIIEFYCFVQKFFVLCPNLKELSIEFTTIWVPSTQWECSQLKHKMTKKPFPKLDKLETFVAEGVPHLILRHFLHNNCGIAQLMVQTTSSDLHKELQIFNKPFCNLRKLDLQLVRVQDVEDFEGCKAVLNLVALRISFPLQHPMLSWSRTFFLLETKLNPKVCTNLCIELPMPTNDFEEELILRDSLFSRLNFPNLQVFTSTIIITSMYLDFLLPCKNSLTEIRVENWDWKYSFYKNRPREEQVIQFLGYRNDIQHSNIRSEIPKLKKIIVNHNACYKFGMNGQVSISHEPKDIYFSEEIF